METGWVTAMDWVKERGSDSDSDSDSGWAREMGSGSEKARDLVTAKGLDSDWVKERGSDLDQAAETPPPHHPS